MVSAMLLAALPGGMAGGLLAAVGGGHVSIVKSLAVVFVLLIWTRLLTWVDKDAPAAHLPREAINSGLMVVTLLAFGMFFLMPSFLIGLVVLLAVLMVGVGGYLGWRSQQVGLSDLQDQFMAFVRNPMGREEGAAKEAVAKAGQVQLFGARGSAMPVPKEDAEERPAYDAAQTLLTDPLRRNAERVEVRPGEGGAGVQYWVDGVVYSGTGLDKATAAALVTYMKSAAGMDVNDRRKPQVGAMRAALDGNKREMQVLTAGSTAGESMRLVFDPKKKHTLTLDALGMHKSQEERLRASIKENQGLVLVSTPRGQGLTSLLYAILRAHDAFLQHVQTLEHNPPVDLEGIDQTKLQAGNTAEELKQAEWVTSQLPDVLMVDTIENPATAKVLAQYAGQEGKRVYVGMNAPGAFEALGLWRRMVGNDAAASANLSMVISGRIMRRLCEACKVPYTPDPDTLRKLNMDPNRVQQLFQARTQPLRDAKGNAVYCEFCQELRYKGRFGVYEMFTVDAEAKKLMAAGASTKQLQQLFRKQRGRFLQEMALLKVEAGETSVQEVLRVMREGVAPAAGAAAASAPPAAGG